MTYDLGEEKELTETGYILQKGSFVQDKLSTSKTKLLRVA